MRIERLDPASTADLEMAAAIDTEYRREVLGDDEPPSTVEENLERLRVGREDIATAILFVREGEVTVGMSFIDIRQGHGNEHMAWLEDLYILRSHRRQGFGRALLEANIELARAAGRSLVIGGFNEGNVDGEAFAKAVGGRIANSERQNRVRLGDLDRALLESWLQPPPGYSLVQFDGACPGDLLDDLITMAAVMNDAPRTESLDDFVFTADHRRRAEGEMAAIGAEYWFAGARHDASGRLAAYTELTYRPFRPWYVEQGDTAVHPDHRGHGIGRWIKAVNALRVLDERPAARVIETWNDGTNKWMLAINDAMGFAPVATWVEAELDV
jgi:mycothiol synthase